MYNADMDNQLREMSERFGQYLCAEIKGAIVTHGFSQGNVAKGIQRQQANLSRWLNANPVIPIAVAYEVCNYIGADLREITNRAEQRVEEEMGPYEKSGSRVTLDDLTEDEKVQIVLDKLSRGDLSVAALHDPNKHLEMEHGADDAA